MELNFNLLGAAALLGLYHGINPALGWLLAASMGIKEKSKPSLALAVFSLTIGHFIAIALIMFAAAAFDFFFPRLILGWVVAGLLTAFGVYHLLRANNPSIAGINTETYQIAIWSFLTALAQGEGLLLFPFVLGESRPGFWGGAVIDLVHSAAYFAAAGFGAFILFVIFRRVRVSFDFIWAISLLLTAAFFIFIYLA